MGTLIAWDERDRYCPRAASGAPRGLRSDGAKAEPCHSTNVLLAATISRQTVRTIRRCVLARGQRRTLSCRVLGPLLLNTIAPGHGFICRDIEVQSRRRDEAKLRY